MRTMCLHDKQEIAAYLRQQVYLHIYSLGDLDDFFWPQTTWYASVDTTGVRQLALLYTATSLPVLLCIAEQPTDETRQFLHSLLPLLPRRFYAHLNSEMTTVFAHNYQLVSHGLHDKMALLAPHMVQSLDTAHVTQVTREDLPALEELYRVSYPGNWFDPRMLETGQYYGVRRDGRLVSVAGIHVYSPQYRVAALGNITTHPATRRQRLALTTSAKVCQSLLQSVDHIGLNVKSDNRSAIACYEQLGFARIASYEEFMCTAKTV